MAGLRNERRLPTKTHNRRKTGGKEDKRKTENDATIDWMMEEGYSKLKQKAGKRDEWRNW